MEILKGISADSQAISVEFPTLRISPPLIQVLRASCNTFIQKVSNADVFLRQTLLRHFISSFRTEISKEYIKSLEVADKVLSDLVDSKLLEMMEGYIKSMMTELGVDDKLLTYHVRFIPFLSSILISFAVFKFECFKSKTD
jgi:hypothetical protein